MVYYGNQRHLEYDFLIAPHADPKQIRLHFAGAQGVHINPTGELVVRTQGRELTWQKPTVYQQDRTGKHRVAARFRLKTLPNGQAGVSFTLGRYDTARSLVIDPVFLYSTYLGGSTAILGDSGNGIDGNGNAYVTGFADSTDFPTTAGAFQQVNKAQGASNAFVTKLSTLSAFPDFNNDGFTDLVFQNQTTNQIAIWYMNGPNYADGTVLTTVPGTGFKVVGIGDYHGDGSADLLFQNQTSNQAAV